MKLRRLVLLFGLLVALVGSSTAPLISLSNRTVRADVPEQEDFQGTGPDFTRLIFLGDSLTAGFQSSSLFQTGQESGYSAQLAKQAGAGVIFPVISNPGLPPNGQLTLNKSICQSQFPVGFLNITAVQGAGTRANPQQQATNVAVPGQTVGDAISLKPKPITNPATATITDIILGLPGFLATPPIARTQLEWVEALKPTTAVVWIGNNDALGAVGGGSDKLLTPLADFTTRYTELMRRVKATGATNIFVSNIPDVTSIALLLSQDDVAKISGQNKETLQFIFGIGKKDFILPTGLALLPRGQKLPDNVVLTKKEIKVIRKAVEDYNKVISAQAAANGATLVDNNKLLADVAKNGVTIDGVGKVTTRPFGGLFGLDFVHPSNTGYAVTANSFITAINAKGGKLTPVDLKAVATADPLVCKPGTEFEGEQPLPSLEEFQRVAPLIERNLRVLTDPNYPILVPDGR